MKVDFQARGLAALEVDCIFKESTVTAAYATSPMKLLTPKARGTSVCAYASNFGGGLVAGDQTRLQMRLGGHTRCFFGTQASTKVYRNPHSLPCSHVTHATVGPDALLVFAPAPVQPFAGSSYEQRQEFHLAGDAALVLLDWFTSGRAARGERWAFERLFTRNEIWQSPVSNAAPETGPTASRCLFLDCCCLDSKDQTLSSRYRTGRFNCFAMLVFVGRRLKTLTERILEEVRRLPVKQRAALLICGSPIPDGVVLRLAGEQVSDVERCLRKNLSSLVEILGEDPWSRRY